MGGVARDGADVEAVLQVAQQLVVGVDDRDVVGLLAGEVVRSRPADLAGPEDDDFHQRCPAGLIRAGTLRPRRPFLSRRAIVRLTRPRGWRSPSSATSCPGARSSPA